MKVFIANFNDVLTPLYDRLPTTEDRLAADVMILWQDVHEGGAVLAKGGKELGKRVVVVEHGFRAHTDYGPPLFYPLNAEIICVMGKQAKRDLVAWGIAPERVEVTGSPIFDRLMPRVPHEGFRVVFVPYHHSPDVLDNWDIAKVLKTLPDDIRVVSKLTEQHVASHYPNPVDSYRQGDDHIRRCMTLLSQVDLVVGMCEGTFEAMAYAMDIPVLIVDHWTPKEIMGQWMDNPNLGEVGGAEVVPLDGLVEAIKSYKAHPYRYQERRRDFVKDNILLGSNATENIARVVEGLI